MKLPSMQFYPGDWRKDPAVQSLDYESRGIWWEIICLMFESADRGKMMLNGRSMDDDEMANCLGIDVAKLKQTLGKLLSKGVASIDDSTGALMCRRMVRDNMLRKVRAEAGHLGGKQKASKLYSKRKQRSTPSTSTSISSSTSIDKTRPHDLRAVIDYMKEIEMPEPENQGAYFLDYHEKFDWTMKGGKKIKDWRAAARNWKRNKEIWKSEKQPLKRNLPNIGDELAEREKARPAVGTPA